MDCRSCGASVPPNAAYCPICGSKVVDNIFPEDSAMRSCAPCETELSNGEGSRIKSNTRHEKQTAGKESTDHPSKDALEMPGIGQVIKYVIFTLIFICFKETRKFFGLVAFFVTPVCLIILLIQTIRKKPKVKWGIATLVSIGIFLITGLTASREDVVVPGYTEAEHGMYQTMVLGYGEVLNRLVNPTTANFIECRYNADENLALFYFTSENRVGGTVTSYARYNGEKGWLDISEEQKKNFEGADITVSEAEIKEYAEYWREVLAKESGS